jgi:hypothetical protein
VEAAARAAAAAIAAGTGNAAAAAAASGCLMGPPNELTRAWLLHAAALGALLAVCLLY